MMRFLRVVLFAFGLALFIATLLRLIQPAHAEDWYLTVYASRGLDDCCYVYMVNPAKNTAERVRVNVKAEEYAVSFANSVSSSGEWQVALVRTGSATRPYLIKRIRNQNQPPLLLDAMVARSHQLLWSAQDDRLFLVVRGSRARLGLYLLLPEDPRLVRLTPDMFTYVRSLNEQMLPTTSFTPYMLFFLAGNLLLIAACLPYARTTKKPLTSR